MDIQLNVIHVSRDLHRSDMVICQKNQQADDAPHALARKTIKNVTLSQKLSLTYGESRQISASGAWGSNATKHHTSGERCATALAFRLQNALAN